MQAIIFIGIQGAGKSTFFKERFYDTHIRINLDMLRTKHREKVLIEACLEAKQPFVIDKTNPTREARAGYIERARLYKFSVAGYYFASDLAEAIERNKRRAGRANVPEKAIVATYNRLEIPALSEGFDELFYVKSDEAKGFTAEEWRDEI
ncbi:MAG: ATP-binding protein [Pyrinomonadaceae bacterium]